MANTMNGLAPRVLCAQVLTRTLGQKSYGNLLLHSALKKSEMDARDRALCTALFQGTMEHLLTADACIRVHSKRPPEKLDLPVLCVLRCGIYELLYMDTPEAAAVNLWAEVCKSLKKTSASGMVNAVLRGFLRGGKNIPMPEDETAAMSVRYSVPESLVSRLLKDYDRETVSAFLEDAQQVPPVYIRCNPLRGNADVPGAEPVSAIDGALRLLRGNLPDIAGNGNFHVQDLASQLCCLAVDPRPGETVVDVCAAPGGKTFTLAGLMQNKGHIYAYDLHSNRVKLIQDGAKRLGFTCITAETGDARETQHPPADRVLCDVPCSGYGVIRRKPEIRYKPLEDAESLPDIQYAILEAAARAVKPGGVLVYSTCTVLKAENEEVVRRFLAAHNGYTLEKPWQDIPALAAYGQEMTTLFPAMLGSDGFFLAKMRKA